MGNWALWTRHIYIGRCVRGDLYTDACFRSAFVLVLNERNFDLDCPQKAIGDRSLVCKAEGRNGVSCHVAPGPGYIGLRPL